MSMQVWSVSDVGIVRRGSPNEDTYLIEHLDEHTILAAVCDGMGGANAGEVASAMATNTFCTVFAAQHKKNMSDEKLQQALRRFRSELADVTIDDKIDVVLDGFLSFADFFFDGLFTSMAVNDRIKKSKADVDSARSKIYSTLRILETLAADNQTQWQKTKEQLDSLK